MNGLHTARLKPNPAGKDRSLYHVDNTQLVAEWVDIKNATAGTVSIGGLELYHLAYPRDGGRPTWEKVCVLSGNLGSGQVLRIHSGREVPVASMRLEDRTGADFHTFSNREAYVWNNAESDTSGIWKPAAESWVDRATYDANPPEGVVLVRVGEKLVAEVARTRGY